MFEHVLVDEYQDLNALQVEIVRALRREQRGLTAVGDDAQAIYGFRAASAEHILDFREHFPDATVVTLERNYRSTQPILDLANAVAARPQRAPTRSGCGPTATAAPGRSSSTAATRPSRRSRSASACSPQHEQGSRCASRRC